jgi:hypothetical protein
MDQVAQKFYNMHSSLADILKKLMKNNNCKERVLKWMRHAVDLNLEKIKMVAHKPVASNGFMLNYIDLLLQLCKPFISNITKYGQFLPKINSFYYMTNDYINKAKDFDKIDGS